SRPVSGLASGVVVDTGRGAFPCKCTVAVSRGLGSLTVAGAVPDWPGRRHRLPVSTRWQDAAGSPRSARSLSDGDRPAQKNPAEAKDGGRPCSTQLRRQGASGSGLVGTVSAASTVVVTGPAGG